MPNSWKLLIILAIISVTQKFHVVDGYNILAIVTLPLKSHYMAFDRLFRELANQGHHVTIMNNYYENSHDNMTFIDLSHNRKRNMEVPPMSDYESLGKHYSRWINFYRHLISNPWSATEDCENLFLNKYVRELLSKKVKYDVIFVEQFMSDCGLTFAAALFDAPIIGITSHTLLPWSYYRLGLPFDFSSDTFYFSNAGTYPNIYYKIESYLANALLRLREKQTMLSIQDVFKKYAPEVDLCMDEVIGKMKMMFVYQHYSVTGSRIMSPQVLEIGGMHIDNQKPVPQHIEEFIKSAKHGVIYLSFGSNLMASTMSKNKLQQFLDAFHQLPYKIIWKLENTTLPAGNDKIMTSSWLPQRDILCHPKVLGFISHGGMLSLSEAAHCGKPMVAIPFFGDQYSNAAAIENSGLGVTMSFNEVTADSLVEAINLITSPEMQNRAQNIHDHWHDRPANVLDSAIYWTQYVARHRTAPPSPPTKYSTWFQKSLLDVYSALFAVFVIIILIIYVVFKLIVALIRRIFSKILGLFRRKGKVE